MYVSRQDEKVLPNQADIIDGCEGTRSGNSGVVTFPNEELFSLRCLSKREAERPPGSKARERAAPPHTVDNEGGADDTASDPDRLHALGPQRLGAAVQASDVRDLRGLCCRWPLSSRYDGANVAGYFLAMPA